MSNWFCLSRRCLCCLVALRGTFTTKQQWCIRTALCAMAKLGWRQFWHAWQKWLLSSHPWPNMGDQCTTWKKNEYAIMYWNQFCYIFFSVLRHFESNRGYLLRNSIELTLKTLEKINFDMFYKNDCWAVICYPICVTNVWYEREIIVLSFPVIRFVILILVFLRFEIKSGFPFYWLALYTMNTVLLDFQYTRERVCTP